MASKKRFSASITLGGAVSSTLKNALKSTSTQLRGIGKNIAGLRERQQRLSAVSHHWEKMGRDAGKYRRELTRVNATLKRHTQLQTVLRHQDSNQQQRHSLKGQLMEGAALGISVALPIKVAGNFQQEMANVGAVIRGVTDNEMSRLTQKARELGASTDWSASQVGQGMGFLSKAGFKVEETFSAIPGVLNLATAAGSDLAMTSDIASNILSGFNLEAAKMGMVGDILTNTFTTSNTDLSMLGETMKFVAPVASSLGVSLNTTAAMAGKLGDAGIQGSQAGTALRAMLSRLASPSRKASELLGTLGIKTRDASGNLRHMPAILTEMNTAMNGMGTAAKSKITSAVFGLEAMSAATVLIGKSNGLDAYTAKISRAGAASEVAKKRSATFMGATRRLSSATESLGITVGNVLLPPLTSLIRGLSIVIGGLSRLAESIPWVTKPLVWLTAGVIGLKVATLAGALTMTVFKGALLTTRLALLKTGLVMPWLAGGIRLVGAAMMANPIAAIGMGIVAVAGLIMTHWEPVKTFFTTTLANISFSSVLEGLKAVFSFSPLGLVIRNFSPAFEWLRNKFSFVDRLGHFLGIKSTPSASEAMPESDVFAATAPQLSPNIKAKTATPNIIDQRTFQPKAEFHITQQPDEDGEALARRIHELDQEHQRNALFEGIPAYG